ncbi:hypothetical protein UFOVP83_20 [uncultured Caudovirales phage]|uniref:Uncharacterized protein n=1 Tax=uncultured Caudovirales phage TaxID=2100421 RepID=A0A6J5TEM8_9CAUD|nr:hypothetical protein UFOVP83_20 [uncultured Caudovirales phage]
MSAQNSIAVYAAAIQFHLYSIVTPVPVYANFNRNFANESKFITWQLRNVHQPVYTGVKANKGIDRPTFQINVFAQTMPDAFNLSDSVIQSLHGFQGVFGNPSGGGFFIAKADVAMLLHTYDNESGLNQIVLDCTLDVPA